MSQQPYNTTHRSRMVSAGRWALAVGAICMAIGLGVNAYEWSVWWKSHVVTITVTQIPPDASICLRQ